MFAALDDQPNARRVPVCMILPRIAPLVLLLLLAGCLEDQKRSMARCQEDLVGREPLTRSQRFGIPLTISEEAREIELCMKQAGYKASTIDSDCDSADEIIRGLMARCYIPTNLVGRWMTMIELAWANRMAL